MQTKLILKDGIIQNKELDGVPVVLQIVTPNMSNQPPAGYMRQVRTLEPMKYFRGVTIHNTGVALAGRDAMRMATYIQALEDNYSEWKSFHFAVDAEKIVQILPVNEVAWHAGDLSGDGNMATIGIEICENQDMDYRKSERNGQILAAYLLRSLGGELFKHEDWSNKYCPHRILRENRWEQFKGEVYALRRGESLDSPTTSPEKVTPEKIYRVQVGAFTHLDNAALYRSRLEQLGFNAYIVETNMEKER